MSNDLDWQSLNGELNPTTSRYRFADVSHLFKKVAFDVYKPLNESEQLWVLEEDDSGVSYIAALYDDPDDITVESNKDQIWSAASDKDGKNVTLSYKNMPITRFASAEYGFEPDEAIEFATFLEAKATNNSFVKKLMVELPEAKRELLTDLLGQNN